MQLQDLKQSITEMSKPEALNLILAIRRSRVISKNTRRKPKPKISQRTIKQINTLSGAELERLQCNIERRLGLPLDQTSE